MTLTDILAQSGGLASIARELGVPESQVAAGAQALVPAIVGGFKKQAQGQPTGLDGLGGLLNALGGGGLLDDVLSPQPTNIGRGNDVLGHIFGSKDISRTVAHTAAQRSGLSPDLLKQMLPMLAMMVGGALSRQAGSGGGMLGDVLGGLLAGGRAPGTAQATTGGGVGSLLDIDGNGNPLDDILRMAGRVFR